MNPARNRPGELIGGGFLVLRRGKRSGRVRPSFMAFEHASWAAAVIEADRLAAAHPGERFQVFQWTDQCLHPVQPAAASA